MFKKIKRFFSGSQDLKQAIVVRSDLKMGKGKLAAQCSHASVAAFIKAQKKDSNLANDWLTFGMKKIVLKVDSKQDLLKYFQQCKDEDLPVELIQDAGHTQVEPGTITCFGVGPASESDLNKILGKLKLL